MIPEHARDYVRVISWHNGLSVITLGGKYTLMPSGDLVITNVNDDAARATYYCTAVNILTGEKYFSNHSQVGEFCETTKTAGRWQTHPNRCKNDRSEKITDF